jgi:O-antigen biosynthesis protein
MDVVKRLKNSVAYVTVKEARKALLRRLALPKFLGREFHCPVCGTGLNAFKPIWNSFQRQMRESPYPFRSLETFNWQAYSCPACDASDRERLYALYLDRVLAQRGERRARVVEFAPSPGLRRKLRRNPALDYRGADLVRQTVDDQVDTTDMRGYGDGSIDVLLCSHILEHVPDDRKAMREMHRVLKPDGFGIVMVPLLNGVEETEEDPALTRREARIARYGNGDHVRQYGSRDFHARLEQAGFRVALLGEDYFGADVFRAAGIAPDSRLWVVTKGA